MTVVDSRNEIVRKGLYETTSHVTRKPLIKHVEDEDVRLFVWNNGDWVVVEDTAIDMLGHLVD